MALNLSQEDREKFQKILSKAKPYDADDPVVHTIHGEMDFDRWNATMAKRFLEQDDREKENMKYKEYE